MFKENSLEGKVGIVTGGSSGIGQAIAAYLLKHGARLTITGRDPAKLEKAAAELGAGVLTAAGDVRQSAQVAANLQSHIDHYGKVDFLINNAGGNFICPLENMSENAFRSVLEIVTMGTFLWSKSVLPAMKAAGQGRIINIGTTYSWGSAAMVGHSGAAKAAILNLTRTMAVEWGPLGINTNLIAPGAVEGTEGVRRLMVHPKAEGLLKKLVPVGRLARGEEIGSMALYLLSPLGDYINGAAIPVDGGYSLNVVGLYPPGISLGE